MPLFATHDGPFHGDDVACGWVLQFLWGKDFELLRTRVPLLLEKADVVCDVGGELNAKRNRFDHHFPGAPLRPVSYLTEKDLSPYSAIGLVWLKYGQAVVDRIVQTADLKLSEEQRKALAEEIDQTIIAPIDAVDNNRGTIASVAVGDQILRPVFAYNLTWLEIRDTAILENVRYLMATEAFGHALTETVTRAAATIDQPQPARERMRQLQDWFHARMTYEADWRLKIQGVAVESARPMIAEAVILARRDNHPRILVLKDPQLPWQQALDDAAFREIDFVVEPESINLEKWYVRGVPKMRLGRNPKILFPKKWRGSEDEKLAEITGLPGKQFCHPEGFVAGAATRKEAFALARMALVAHDTLTAGQTAPRDVFDLTRRPATGRKARKTPPTHRPGKTD